MAKTGEAAPPVVGETLDGAPFDLASLRGHPVVLNFWGSWCVPCREEFPLLLDRVTRLQARPETAGLRQLELDLLTLQARALDQLGRNAAAFVADADPQEIA